MVEMKVPDRLSIMTYVSQYYNYFKDKTPGEIETKYISTKKVNTKIMSESLPTKRIEDNNSTPAPEKTIPFAKKNLCSSCGKVVYLMERFFIEGKLFHRVCFKCVVCGKQLKTSTYEFDKIAGKFYCSKDYKERKAKPGLSNTKTEETTKQLIENKSPQIKNALKSPFKRNEHFKRQGLLSQSPVKTTQNEEVVSTIKSKEQSTKVTGKGKTSKSFFSGVLGKKHHEFTNPSYDKHLELSNYMHKLNADKNTGDPVLLSSQKTERLDLDSDKNYENIDTLRKQLYDIPPEKEKKEKDKDSKGHKRKLVLKIKKKKDKKTISEDKPEQSKDVDSSKNENSIPPTPPKGPAVIQDSEYENLGKFMKMSSVIMRDNAEKIYDNINLCNVIKNEEVEKIDNSKSKTSLPFDSHINNKKMYGDDANMYETPNVQPTLKEGTYNDRYNGPPPIYETMGSRNEEALRKKVSVESEYMLVSRIGHVRENINKSNGSLANSDTEYHDSVDEEMEEVMDNSGSKNSQQFTEESCQHDSPEDLNNKDLEKSDSCNNEDFEYLNEKQDDGLFSSSDNVVYNEDVIKNDIDMKTHEVDDDSEDDEYGIQRGYDPVHVDNKEEEEEEEEEEEKEKEGGIVDSFDMDVLGVTIDVEENEKNISALDEDDNKFDIAVDSEEDEENINDEKTEEIIAFIDKSEVYVTYDTKDDTAEENSNKAVEIEADIAVESEEDIDDTEKEKYDIGVTISTEDNKDVERENIVCIKEVDRDPGIYEENISDDEKVNKVGVAGDSSKKENNLSDEEKENKINVSVDTEEDIVGAEEKNEKDTTESIHDAETDIDSEKKEEHIVRSVEDEFAIAIEEENKKDIVRTDENEQIIDDGEEEIKGDSKEEDENVAVIEEKKIDVVVETEKSKKTIKEKASQNPFDDSSDEEEVVKLSSKTKPDSYNPFLSSDDESPEKIDHTNPFFSSGDEDEEDDSADYDDSNPFAEDARFERNNTLERSKCKTMPEKTYQIGIIEETNPCVDDMLDPSNPFSDEFDDDFYADSESSKTNIQSNIDLEVPIISSKMPSSEKKLVLKKKKRVAPQIPKSQIESTPIIPTPLRQSRKKRVAPKPPDENTCKFNTGSLRRSKRKAPRPPVHDIFINSSGNDSTQSTPKIKRCLANTESLEEDMSRKCSLNESVLSSQCSSENISMGRNGSVQNNLNSTEIIFSESIDKSGILEKDTLDEDDGPVEIEKLEINSDDEMDNIDTTGDSSLYVTCDQSFFDASVLQQEDHASSCSLETENQFNKNDAEIDEEKFDEMNDHKNDVVNGLENDLVNHQVNGSENDLKNSFENDLENDQEIDQEVEEEIDQEINEENDSNVESDYESNFYALENKMIYEMESNISTASSNSSISQPESVYKLDSDQLNQSICSTKEDSSTECDAACVNTHAFEENFITEQERSQISNTLPYRTLSNVEHRQSLPDIHSPDIQSNEKRKAPPKPPRQYKELTSSNSDYKQAKREEMCKELEFLEVKQRELEMEGVVLEKKLRGEGLDGEPEEAYLFTWFELVNQKNQLLRRENELIYMCQELDFLQNQRSAELELRQLMMKPDDEKTEYDTNREAELLAKILSFVTKRSNIIDQMDEDRIREEEEDQEILLMMAGQGFTNSSPYISEKGGKKKTKNEDKSLKTKKKSNSLIDTNSSKDNIDEVKKKKVKDGKKEKKK